MKVWVFLLTYLTYSYDGERKGTMATFRTGSLDHPVEEFEPPMPVVGTPPNSCPQCGSTLSVAGGMASGVEYVCLSCKWSGKSTPPVRTGRL